MKKILVIGSTVADVIVNLDVLPKTAEDVHIKSQSVALGGCAHNVSDMIGHYNVPYDLFSPVGTGIYGDFVRKRLAEKGVTSTAPTPDMANGCCYCFVESSGERTFIVEHGAEYLFEPEWFSGLKTEDYASVYVCGLEIEEKTGDVVVDFLEKSGLPVFFAPGPRLSRIDPSLMERIFALHPILHLNDDEAREYTAAATIEAAAAILYSRTQAMIVITTGADGACVYDGSALTCVPSVKVEHIVDTIGAGDGHLGAFMANLALGLDPITATAKANAAAAALVSVQGGYLTPEQFSAAGLRE